MKKSVIKRRLEGEVISHRMAKTVLVRVARIKVYPKYKKRYKDTKKYKVYDEKDQYQVVDLVVIEACRPLSRDKRWRVIKKIKPGKA